MTKTTHIPAHENHRQTTAPSAAVKQLYLIAGANGSGKSTTIYVFVDSPEVCIARIAARVKNGGHYIPDEDVRRRYVRSKHNFLKVYATLACQWTLFYNGASQADMVARKDVTGHTTIFSESLYDLFTEEL